MTLIATDEFWQFLILADASSGAADENREGDAMPVVLEPPPPHPQLLADEPASREGLKGYDHTQEVYDATEEEPSFCCRRELPGAKKEGGASWLPALALLGETPDDVDPPGLVRDVSDEESDGDSSEDDGSATEEEEGPAPKAPPKRRAVSFNAAVTIQPIPHSSTLTPLQRSRMYCSCLEVRQNKIRNKKEFRYDGYDWRNATEEWEMELDTATGELVHPAHGEWGQPESQGASISC